ncbi:serpin B9-like [Paramacrobiotus metropolitanus]|uniref:serpin B9-like n=1 Tax=Paramacrobiotus metropolitanus TaxID=2943436 RepID=UPI002446190B|nr:serpin B9-like [Paramacrobiotus metropolitanus]
MASRSISINLPSLAFNQLLDNNVAQLYSAATALKPDGNLAVSPLSILYASALMYIGSSGSTKSNLEKSFHFDQYFSSNTDSVLSAFSTSMANLTSVKTDGGPFVINLANGIFLQKGSPFVNKFKDAGVSKLKSEAQFKDFRTGAEKARGEINTWVSDKTNGRIKDLLPSVSADAIAILVNALYFKASWESWAKFDPSLTVKMDFTLLNGQKTKVNMMQNFLYSLAYAEDSTLDAKYIEYTYTNNLGAMLFLLPNKKNGLRALEKKLTAGIFNTLKKKAKEERVSLQIPKFKVETSFNLKTLLQKIGVKEAFDKNSADFSYMTPQKPVWIGAASHKTFVEIDEQGTEAAAASAFEMPEGASMQEEPPKEFVADHPFIFAIRHNPTNAILFLGRVEIF